MKHIFLLAFLLVACNSESCDRARVAGRCTDCMPAVSLKANACLEFCHGFCGKGATEKVICGGLGNSLECVCKDGRYYSGPVE